jgi:molybdopterin molybdotransferase
MTFAAGPAGVVFALPGNPVSAFLMFHLFVLRGAAALCGGGYELTATRLPLAAPFRRSKAKRHEYVPARLLPAGMVAALPYHGSAHLTALPGADGFLQVPRGVRELPAGEAVAVLLLGRGAS